MGERRRKQVGSDFARQGQRFIAVAFVSALLAGCGGGDDSPAAAAAPGASPQTGAASSTGGASSRGAAPSTGAEPPAATPGSSGGSEGLTAEPSATKGATTLSWTPPTRNDDGTPLKLTGYRIYWGNTEGHYPHSVTLTNPGLTRYVVEDLKPATWYFVATALSADAESPPSNVVAMRIH